MLFTQRFSRAIAVVAVCILIAVGLPARCEDTNQPGQDACGESRIETVKDKPVLIAQATCASCGAELNSIALMASSGKHKDTSLLTDSLWGNLILKLAYQRDPQLRKIATRLKIASLCTKGAIGTVAGGTLAQGIAAVVLLNPVPPHLDTYVPLIMGTALSSLILMIMVGKTTSNYVLVKQIKNRQLAIKKHVEAILAHMEACGGNCPDARKELTELIGEHAAREWVELFRSSHQLAMTSPRKVSMLTVPGVAE